MDMTPIDLGMDIGASKIAYLLDGVRDQNLPKEQWTHAAHLVSGLALIDEQGVDGAKAQMPDIIRGFNESVGGENTDTDGYHHTITLAYLEVLGQFRARHADKTLAEAATLLLNSPIAERAYLLQFYSKAVLFSVVARREYVAPDLQPIWVQL